MSANISFTPGDATRRHELWRYGAAALDGPADGVLLTTLAPGISSYEDPDGSTAHRYGVMALGDGDPSELVLTAGIAPSVPEDFAFVSAAPNNYSFEWTPVPNVLGYRLYAADNGGAETLLATIDPEDSEWGPDTEPDAALQRRYRLTAFNAYGESDPTPTPLYTPPVAPTFDDVQVDGTEVAFFWEHVGGWVDEWIIEWYNSTSLSGWFSAGENVPEELSKNFDWIDHATSGETISVRVRARKGTDYSAWLTTTGIPIP